MRLTESLRNGIIAILTGVILWIFGIHVIGGFLVVVGLILAIIQAINLRNPEFDRFMDERVERISERAGFNSFFVIISCIAILRALSWFYALNLERVLESLFIVGMASFILFRAYYSRRELR